MLHSKKENSCNSEWVESLKSYAGGIALHPDSSIYDIGIDWIAPYNSTQHSIGILFIRCADMDPHNKGKIWNQGVIAIIPGPRMPSVLCGRLSIEVSTIAGLITGVVPVGSVRAGPCRPCACTGREGYVALPVYSRVPFLQACIVVDEILLPLAGSAGWLGGAGGSLSMSSGWQKGQTEEGSSEGGSDAAPRKIHP
ncbi:hypothetical protein VOLCADRAFT_104765 [Volvox carteri f. nagariensis]|uniref:Uncharacterized protein n=1 Tax=Volvox carteri f. nagariensis TaxID=3068 RepID=D8TVW5_VOLCA|nr:uncharacterized protein VOLCADRAFT_104765 [Volvox carteri f. nagariensis]EFJ48375.1 hypothetical protein VOLCADRAFT_104765 [Volvox carteri f. nagariensis]|eukprot:XP_002950629.1 hypothetical protein VOLCADRAFT_104765 [Volvox carteri f. nagariensis]